MNVLMFPDDGTSYWRSRLVTEGRAIVLFHEADGAQQYVDMVVRLAAAEGLLREAADVTDPAYETQDWLDRVDAFLDGGKS